MRSLQADLELTALHIKRVEARLAAQRAKIAIARAIGRRTESEEEAFRELAKSLEYLKSHLANVAAPANTHKAS